MEILSSNRQNFALPLMALVSVLLLGACGGGGKEQPEIKSGDLLKGTFVDSPVANLHYRTSTQEGRTTSAGEFIYIKGETITFSIGGIDFPTVLAQSFLTPLDLVGSSDINHPAVVNIARLLQSLDADGSPENGIEIDEQAHSVAQGLILDFESLDFDRAVTNLVANSGSTTTILIDKNEAIAHLKNTLGIENDADADADHDGVINGIDIDDDNDGLVEIRTLGDLNEIRNNLDGSTFYGSSAGCAIGCRGFELMNDLNFDTNGNQQIDEGDEFSNKNVGGKILGWEPIGTQASYIDQNYDIRENAFKAVFNGNGHVIKNLYINRPNAHSVGLFGVIADAQIENLKLHDINSIYAFDEVGGLVGQAWFSTISMISIKGGVISGWTNIGGVVGYAFDDEVTSSYSNAVIVSADANSGGLIGHTASGSVRNSYSDGAVRGSDNAGGLIGLTGNTLITNAYATGIVSGNDYLGGLIGLAKVGTVINQSYSLGDVTGRNYLGGLVGGVLGAINTDIAVEISQVYVGGDVLSEQEADRIGGLVGYIEDIQELIANQVFIRGDAFDKHGVVWEHFIGYGDSSLDAELMSSMASYCSPETNYDNCDVGPFFNDWDSASWSFDSRDLYPTLKAFEL